MKVGRAEKLIMFLIFFIPFSSFSDVWWKKTYSGDRSRTAKSIEKTGDGNFLIAGTLPAGGKTADGYLLKVSPEGDELWSSEIDLGQNEFFNSAIETRDKGILAVGYSSKSPPKTDILIVKTDSKGKVVWSKIFGEEKPDQAKQAIEVKDGYIIAGSTGSFGAKGMDAFLIKINNKGELLWVKTYGGKLVDMGAGIVKTEDGNFALAGFTDTPPSRGYDSYLVKVNEKGEKIWEKVYQEPGIEVIQSVDRTKEDGFILAGYTTYPGKSNFKKGFFAVIVDKEGQLINKKSFYEDSKTRLYSVRTCEDGNFVLAGAIYSDERSNWDPYILKVNKDLKVLWKRIFTGVEYETALSILPVSNDGYYFVGYSIPPSKGIRDAMLTYFTVSNYRGKSAGFIKFWITGISIIGFIGLVSAIIGFYLYYKERA